MVATPVGYNKFPPHTGSRQKMDCMVKVLEWYIPPFLLSKSSQFNVQKSAIMVSEVLDDWDMLAEVARSLPSREQ